MIAIAFAAHVLLLGAAVFVGEFSVRPLTPPEAYTVEVVTDGELGGHMPAGLPKVDLGGEQAAKQQVAKAAPRPEPKPPPKPEVKPEPPPEPEQPPEPPSPPEPAKPAPEPVKEEPKPEPPADDKPAREGDLVVATATPAPTAKPTAVPTARPTAKPTARPTARPTAAPTATAQPTARPVATAKPAAPQATATPARSPAASPGRSPAAAPKPTVSPVIVVKPRSTPAANAATAPGAQRSPQAAPTSEADGRIAEALARVQRSVGQQRDGAATGPSEGSARAPGADARGSGGVGGTDAPDPNRRIGIGPGRGGAGEVRGVEFLLYYNQMLARIRDAWVYTGGATTAEVKVRFRIQDDGSVIDLRVTQPSGDGPYDASVVRAVRGASPLAPPPEKYRADFADVELTFQPGDLKAPR